MKQHGESLIGPSADERGPKLTIDTIALADGSPLYHALLDPNTLIVSDEEVQEAHARLLVISVISPDSVLLCQSKSREEARIILESIENSSALQVV